MYKILCLLCIVVLSGCAGQQRATNNLANSLNTQGPEYVLDKLQANEPDDRDIAQYHLNLGYLQLINGDFKSAITTLSLAKREMAVLEAMSVSETAAAGTVSEIYRSYSGYPTDRVLIHNMLALSYLFNQDIDGARVEMLQADVSMKKLAQRKSVRGQLASVHLLAGVIYELLDERSSSLISYKHASELLKERGIAQPLGLKKALLRMSYKLGADEQYAAYKKQFPGLAKPEVNGASQLFTLYFDGVVSNKQEKAVMVPSHDAEQLIRIAMPAYPPLKKRPQRATITQGNQRLTTQLIENLETLVRDDLDDEYPSILLLTTTRALAKYELVDKANEKDSLIGLLVNIATLVTEVADLRSWNMLPSNIQFAYLETTENEVLINSADNVQKIELPNRSQNLVLINSLSEQIFHYQQN
ncbi:COG3014 family protein [Psychromonas ossibalaenae]|uniref:COG3014 family protein n=1 Tax=Psychromonas ossibalaenae TaxID=444922 RepID=UPI00036C91D1|nr:hypothetical protein [Psychromonas ossibalaenae]